LLKIGEERSQWVTPLHILTELLDLCSRIQGLQFRKIAVLHYLFVLLLQLAFIDLLQKNRRYSCVELHSFLGAVFLAYREQHWHFHIVAVIIAVELQILWLMRH